jgi:hypothetical protein
MWVIWARSCLTPARFGFGIDNFSEKTDRHHLRQVAQKARQQRCSFDWRTQDSLKKRAVHCSFLFYHQTRISMMVFVDLQGRV